MISVEFTEVEARNLITFLQTTSLTGKDVPAFVDVLNKITDGMEKKGDMGVNELDD